MELLNTFPSFLKFDSSIRGNFFYFVEKVLGSSESEPTAETNDPKPNFVDLNTKKSFVPD